MINYFKTLFFCAVGISCFAFFFAFSPIALATDQIDIQNLHRTYNIFDTQYPVFGSTFIPTQNNFAGIYYQNNGHFGSSTILTLCFGAPEFVSNADVISHGTDCSWPQTLFIKRETIIGTDSGYSDGIPNYTKLFFANPVQLNIGQPYFFIIDVRPDAQQDNIMFDLFATTSNQMILDASLTYNLNFIEFYDDTFVANSVRDFTFDYPPPDGSGVYAGMPAMIDFTYTNPDDEYSRLNFEIARISTPAFSYALKTIPLEISTTPLSRQLAIDLPNGSYTIEATFATADYSAHTLAGFTTFAVSGSTNPAHDFSSFYNATSTLSTFMDDICSGIATSTLAGGLECILKRSVAWAFYPSVEAVNQLSTSYDYLKSAFPFSAFYGLTDAVNTAIASTSTSTTGSFKMPMITATGSFYMLPVLTASSVPNLIGSANYTIFRNSLGYMLWCLAGFIVFITFKKI